MKKLAVTLAVLVAIPLVFFNLLSGLTALTDDLGHPPRVREPDRRRIPGAPEELHQSANDVRLVVHHENVGTSCHRVHALVAGSGPRRAGGSGAGK